jgi:hypothetical protein
VIGEVGSAKPGLHSLLPGFMLQLQKELGESLLYYRLHRSPNKEEETPQQSLEQVSQRVLEEMWISCEQNAWRLMKGRLRGLTERE